MKPKGYYFGIAFGIGIILYLIMSPPFGLIFFVLGLIVGGIWESMMRKKGEVPQMSNKERKHNNLAWWIIITFILLLLIWIILMNFVF